MNVKRNNKSNDVIHNKIHEKHRFKNKSITIHNQSSIVYACFVLFVVCLYICICDCVLSNNNYKTKHKNNTKCGSAFEPGASGLPYYCTSICVRFGCARRASSVDSKPLKKKRPANQNRPWRPPQGPRSASSQA